MFVYAIAANFNGYVPTPQRQVLVSRSPATMTGTWPATAPRYLCRPCRTAVCQADTQQRKLQIYRRDTGELMFDMSAPIYVTSPLSPASGYRIYDSAPHGVAPSMAIAASGGDDTVTQRTLMGRFRSRNGPSPWIRDRRFSYPDRCQRQSRKQCSANAGAERQVRQPMSGPDLVGRDYPLG